MTMALLELPIAKPKRVELEPPETIQPELEKLAQEAEKELGYSVLTKAIHGVELLNILRKLEIDPFDRTQVAKYKKAMVDRYNGKPAGDGYRYTARWTKHNLAGYSKPVPEHILEKALELKRALPGVGLTVDSFELSAERIVPADPFLVVSYGSEEYHIEVWDEPEFECVSYRT